MRKWDALGIGLVSVNLGLRVVADLRSLGKLRAFKRRGSDDELDGSRRHMQEPLV